MKRKKKYITGIKYLTIILLLAYFFLPINAAANTGDPVSDAKKGIVEVYSGFADQEGTFHRMKYGGGFLICNDEKGTFIVTNHSSGGFLQRTTNLKIIQARTGKTVVMDKPEYIIGKSQEQADFPITENRAVSRRYAAICWKGEEYFICDLGSSNGTYLQGGRLSEGNPVKLKDGDLVMLADEEFQLRIGRAQAWREEGNEV